MVTDGSCFQMPAIKDGKKIGTGRWNDAAVALQQDRDLETLVLYNPALSQLDRAAFASPYHFLLAPLSHNKTILLILIYTSKEEEHLEKLLKIVLNIFGFAK